MKTCANCGTDVLILIHGFCGKCYGAIAKHLDGITKDLEFSIAPMLSRSNNPEIDRISDRHVAELLTPPTTPPCAPTASEG
jgi:hypothetical protein